MVAGGQPLVHTPFVPSDSWSPCAPLVWSKCFPTPLGGSSVFTKPVKALEIRFSSSELRKQHPRHEKAVSRTSLAVVVCAWPRESISRGRADSSHPRPIHISSCVLL
ncbi:Alpha/beta hydrolase domain-containing protein 11 [Schistosoma haematobium]|uniref:Alpha/beta hydrolase domain-containing protein 11 n=1 Tax=Schistosoma haematobium TaxID=6185 RepID=A0A922S3Y9_SCHHA|nr:Alpha/beta hydrolase domain-containing protein 11 [Schistosoma haematobium]KAH9592417.1 Alpha/beta hydrolase domain-containing protein 11 [Schistosoma haematobium]